jgi:DNA-binding transcriptional ArsR family regulator
LMSMLENDLMSAQMEIYAKFFHGLSNPTRFRIVESLLEGEKSVGELVELLNISQSQVSNQLNCLRYCHFVSSRQEGKFVYYSISDERIRKLIKLGKEIVQENASFINNCTRL